MKMLVRAALALSVFLACAPVAAQVPAPVVTAPANSGTSVPSQGIGFGALGAPYKPVTEASPLPVTDGAFTATAPMPVAGTAYLPGRSIGAQCSVGGTIALTIADGSVLTVTVGAGWQTFPFAATAWAIPAGSGAACTMTELK